MPEQRSEKACTKCGESKPLDGGFYRNGPRLAAWCKECHKANSREHKRRTYVPAAPRPTGEGYDYIVDPATGCWVWQRDRSNRGYGVVYYEDESGHRRRCGAHRHMYEQLVGAVPKGLVLDHLCSNPPCVNPAHLEPVTNAENCRRGAKTRLSEAQVIAIYDDPRSNAAVAREYGLHEAHVSRIRNGHRWGDITGATA